MAGQSDKQWMWHTPDKLRSQSSTMRLTSPLSLVSALLSPNQYYVPCCSGGALQLEQTKIFNCHRAKGYGPTLLGHNQCQEHTRNFSRFRMLFHKIECSFSRFRMLFFESRTCVALSLLALSLLALSLLCFPEKVYIRCR
jgi:hypothetical protein